LLRSGTGAQVSLYVKGFGAAAVRKSAAKKNFADD